MKLISLFLLVSAVWSAHVHAYVAGATSVPVGGFELSLKTELMRGLAGPENLPETQQKQVPNVNIYELSGGYNVGDVSFLEDLKVRLTGSFFTSETELLGGTEIYPKDEGWIVGGEISGNFVHDPGKVFGFFIRAQYPAKMNVAKFVNPKLDTIGLGLQTGLKLSDTFAQETVLFVGSGVSKDGFKQNASISASILGVWIVSASNGAAIRLGPFYEGDIGERNDARYGTQGVRAFRLGLTVSGGITVYRGLSLGVTYTQKFTGAYFRATKDFMGTVNCVF